MTANFRVVFCTMLILTVIEIYVNYRECLA